MYKCLFCFTINTVIIILFISKQFYEHYLEILDFNFSKDHTEIILSSESRIVTYVNKRGERSTYPLSSALENSNYEMTKRLKYTKDILTHMLNMNLQRSSQKKIQSETTISQSHNDK